MIPALNPSRCTTPLRVGAIALAILPALMPTLLVAQSEPAHKPVLQIPSKAPQSSPPVETPAQAPAAKPVKEVKLLAFVHDKKGQPVTDLGKQDFALEQDGHAQAIAGLAANSDPITIGVIADTDVGQRKALGDERKASTEFFNRALRHADRGFVLHFDRDVELLQDVTTSHEKLAQGIDQIAVDSSPHGRPHGPGSRNGSDETPGPRHFSFGGEVLYDAIFLAADEVLKDQPGRKALVVFSDGVDRASKIRLRKAIEAAQRGGVLVYSVYVRSERDDDRRDEMGPAGYPGSGYPPGYPGGYPPGYPGSYPGGYPYPGGSPWPPQRSPEPRDDKDAAKRTLQQIAEETGGRFFELSKKMNAARIFTEIEQEMRHEYMLSYTPDAASPGFHKLRVSVRNPELTVRTVPGFYAD